MRRHLPLIPTAIYVVLFVLAVIPIFTGNDALSGIFAILLSAPWSSLLGKLLPGTGSGNFVLGVGLTVIGAALNASLIYFLSRGFCGDFPVSFSFGGVPTDRCAHLKWMRRSSPRAYLTSRH